MIVKNEEAVLRRCLTGIAPAVDEIIIVDTGSTDKTKSIARAFTKKIYDFKWVDDFSAARNFAFSKATKDYQMWLDADDVLMPDALENLRKLKRSLDTPLFDIITMKYVVSTDAAGNPVFTSTRERLLKREKNYRWVDPVHECIPLVGKVLHTDIAVHHKKINQTGDGQRNLKIYTALEDRGTAFTPRQQFYFARELKDNGQWEKAVGYYEKFLDGGRGWTEDNISACQDLSVCYSALGQTEKVLPILTKSFMFDAPRGEVCCLIGYHHKRQQNYAAALKWFHTAARLPIPKTSGFIQADFYGYIPNIEACVCASELGDYAAAKNYNEQAAAFKPDDPAVIHNRTFLAGKTAQAI